MENSSNNNLLQETLLSTGTNLNSTLLKTVPSTEINNIIGGGEKYDDILEIHHKYNNLKKKINFLFNEIKYK